LQTSIERLDENKARLTVTVPAAEVDRAIAEAYARIGAKLKIPGFRPGKAPRPVIDTHVGREAVLAEAQEDIVNSSFGRALSREDLRTVGQPEVSELAPLEAGADFTYTADITLRPELTLSSAEPVAITVPPQRASEREIDAQIAYVRERFATLEVSDEAVGENDFVLLSFVGLVDGEPYEGNTVDRYLYEVGRGLMPPEFDRALIGAKAGDTVTATFTIPETSAVEEFVGREATFTIEVHEVKRKVLPELDDEFAGNVGGFDTFEEYREDIRQKLDAAKASAHPRQVENAALAALVERLEGAVPEELVASRARSMTRDFFDNLAEREISLAQYVEATGVGPEQIQADIERQAAVRVREELALEALFRALGMEVTEAQVDAAVLELAGGNEEDAARLRADLEENGVLPLVREQIMHRMAADWLIEHAIVTEAEPSDGTDESTAGAASATTKRPRAKRAAKKEKTDEGGDGASDAQPAREE
jgi:trigger factor